MMRTVIAVIVTVSATLGAGQNDDFRVVPPPHYRALVELADCKSMTCLASRRNALPKNEKMANLVFFTKEMMLRPSPAAAEGLLHSMPSDVKEQMMFINFPTWHDDVTKTEHDMVTLGQIYDKWPRMAAKAASLSPSAMSDYVRYLLLASNDIHSDFTGSAEAVCRKQPAAFRNAFKSLPEQEQMYIAKHVFDPASCKAIFRSEAE